MKRMIVLGGLCAALVGCANIHSYDQEGKDIDAKDPDMMACKTEMSSYSSRDEAKEAFDKCMAAKGYEKRVKKYGM